MCCSIKRGGNSLTALVSGLPWTDQLGPIADWGDSHGKSRDINGTPPLPWRAHTSTVFLVLPHTTRRREATVALCSGTEQSGTAWLAYRAFNVSGSLGRGQLEALCEALHLREALHAADALVGVRARVIGLR